jgi:hypothetical protein
MDLNPKGAGTANSNHEEHNPINQFPVLTTATLFVGQKLKLIIVK